MEKRDGISPQSYRIIQYPRKHIVSKENLNYQFEVQTLSISITIFQLPTHKLFLKNLCTRTKNFSFFPYPNLHVEKLEMH